jgi:gliding motility-associated-like protein
MKFLRHHLFVLVFFCLTGNCFGQYIQVDDTYSVQQLIENVLINSPCANASNFTVSGDPFSGGEQSFGYFNAGTSGFPFSEGIVLSTSRAKRTEGPNNNLIDEGLTSWLGDSDLEDALNISGTFNATVMEFDFTPLTSKISFDYIFASEEYQGTAPCQYSDGFAFLLKEAGTTNPYKNLALIPNTTTPVLVTTVHPNIPGRCPAINENYFGGYNGSNAAINFNGQTTVLTAKSDVIPGRIYHIKLVIADHENIRYDSAIFLGGGSFDVGTDLGQDQLISTNNPVCANQTFNIQTYEIGSNSYKWFKDNVEIPLETNSNLIVSTPGTYSIEITLGGTTCIAKGKIVIEYAPAPTLTTINVEQCDEDLDGSTLFNLTKLDTTITNNDPNFGPVTYFENLLDAQNQVFTNAILNPNSYSSSTKTIYATVTNNFGCLTVATISLQVSSNAFPNIVDFETCDLDNVIDGFYAFQLSDIDTQVLNGLPAGLVVTYYPTYNDALLQTNILPSIYTNETQFISRIYAKILDGTSCYGIQPVDLYVNSNLPPNFEDQEVYLCDNVPLAVSIATNFFSYNWSNGDNDFSTQLNAPGDYTVTVTNSDGCEATKKFIAIASGAPTITSVDINDFQGDSNSVTIYVTGLGTWEYSLDGISYQDSTVFNNVLPGEYQVHVRDQFLCGDDTFDIFVLNYPSFFTPNDDTYNDVWTIENIEFYSNAVIQIFDRFGKFLKQIAPQNGWDGTFMGKKLPSDDYWFVMQLNNGRTIKGHFSLKR